MDSPPDEGSSRASSRPRFPESYGVARELGPGMVSWTDVSQRLADARNYWVATTRPDGRPHATPVWGLWIEPHFFFSTDSASRKGRNLAANPQVVVHLESGDDVVILEGVVQLLTDRELLADFVDRYDAKYGFRVDVDNPSYAVFRAQARVAYAWSETDFPNSATRWLLE